MKFYSLPTGNLKVSSFQTFNVGSIYFNAIFLGTTNATELIEPIFESFYEDGLPKKSENVGCENCDINGVDYYLIIRKRS